MEQGRGEEREGERKWGGEGGGARKGRGEGGREKVWRAVERARRGVGRDGWWNGIGEME